MWDLYIPEKTEIVQFFCVQSFANLTHTIIPHFNQYPLKSQKINDFLLFKKALELINPKAISTPEQLQEIINIKASMNTNLSPKLRLAFPHTMPVERGNFSADIWNTSSLDAN